MKAKCLNDVDSFVRLEQGKKYDVSLIDYSNKLITVVDDQGEKTAFLLNRFELENALFEEANLANEYLEKQAISKQEFIDGLMKEIGLIRGEKCKFEMLYNESKVTIDRLNKDNDNLINKAAAYEKLKKQVDSFVNTTDWRV